MVDSNWNIEKYKSEFESEEHWNLRQQFLLAHKDKLPEDELVCMAQVFTNIEFLGCRYPDETMIRVAELAKGVVEDFREKKKNSLKRTFVAASDAASSKVKGLNPSTINKETGFKIFKKAEDTETSSFQTPSFQNNSYGPNLVLKPRSGPFGKLVVVLNRSMNAIQLLDKTVAVNKVNQGSKFEVQPIEGDMFQASYLLQGNIFSQAVAMDKKSSKELAALAALDKFRESCYTIIIKDRNIEDGQCVETTDLDKKKVEEKIGEENVGSKLMRLMGWSGGGLGSKQQGIVEPVSATTTVQRSGLGINEGNKNIPFRESVRQYLLNWLKQGADSDLVFSSDFDKEQRKTTHGVAQKLGLKTKSYGPEGDRRLVVSKKEDLWSLVEELVKNGGYSDKYELVSPGAPLPPHFTEKSILNKI